MTLQAPQDHPAHGRGVKTRSIPPALARVLATAAAIVLGGSSSVFACPVCFGAEEGELVHGTRLGMIALLAVTLAVQGAFVGFFLYLRQRAKRIADLDLDAEWSKLQGGAWRT